MRIHILGASGSGTTTLGQHLYQRTGIPHFDSDYYFWLPTTPPFLEKRNPDERMAMLNGDLAGLKSYILTGSVVSWGESMKSKFDLIIFLTIPPAIRLERLRRRELERYGEIIYTNPERNKQHLDFMEWAAGYDQENFSGRSKIGQERWLAEVTCPVLRIEGDTTIEERMTQSLAKIEELSRNGSHSGMS
ncbi:AAA family ATPase [Siphonobacter sp. SORGH_AS_0500]|uniref:AAA family ATPase n=1 Tax=Siphonobacter sp. SORGH_AS_0500 TaxID=1864824 RepID=UPI002859FC97|nr:AAA family ATPase [Siphonobacter sp. SORGH_AS_0500]MDR6195423.1 adenylate kinase family enzyme [Siphonobacter sp. SORGH_AS_0500]